MRVICIDDKVTHPLMQGLIKMGNEYDTFQCPFSKDYLKIYGLEYNANGCTQSFLKKLFAPLSEIDERDLAHAEPIESTFILKKV